MTINIVDVVKELATWGSLAKLALGAFGHKIISKLIGAEKKLKAEAEKLAAEVKSKL